MAVRFAKRYVISPIQAEGAVLLADLTHAKKMNLTNMWIRSNCQDLVKMVNGSISVPWLIRFMFADIKLLSAEVNTISFDHVCA